MLKIPSSILIVKTSAIGDVLQTFPALDYLRKRFPNAHIAWIVERLSTPLLRAHPLLDEVIEIDTRKWRKNLWTSRHEIRKIFKELRAYDLLFDLQGNSKSAFINCLIRAETKVGFGWKSLPEKLNYLSTSYHIEVPKELDVRKRYLHLVQNYFEDETPHEASAITLQTNEERPALPLKRPRFMVCFGSNWQTKQLKIEQLREFLRSVESLCDPSFLFIYGNTVEEAQAKELANTFEHASVLGQLSLPQWQQVMSEMDLVFCMDSAALHLCATTATPSFSFFGPSSAKTYKPLGNQHGFFQGSCPYGRTFDKRCPVLRSCSTGACLGEVSVKTLFETFKPFWHSLQTDELRFAKNQQKFPHQG